LAILIPEALTDLNRMEDLLSPSTSFPSESKDALIQIINATTRMFLTQSHHGSFKYKSVTETKDGGNHHLLVMNYFPIVTITSIHVDNNLPPAFGTEALIDVDCYEIRIDHYGDATPNSGVIRRKLGTWTSGRSNVQVIYTAGFSNYFVQTGINDQIVIDEGGAAITVTFTEAIYNATTLATEIAAELNASVSTSNTYTVTYSLISHRFRIAVASGETLNILWEAAGTRHKEFGKMIGFDTSVEDTGAEIYVADYPALGVPEDLVDGITSIVRWRYAEAYEKRVGKTSESKSDETFSYDHNAIPDYMISQIEPYFEIRM